MRVLILSWYSDESPDSGERVRLAALTRELRRHHEVELLSFEGRRSGATDRGRIPYRYRSADVLRGLISRRSVHEVVLGGRRLAVQRTRKRLEMISPDIIVVNQLPPWPLVPDGWYPRTIFDSHNAEGRRLARIQQSLPRGGVAYHLYAQQGRAAVELETRIARGAAAVWAVSEEDRRYFEERGAKSVVVANGVDPSRVRWPGLTATGPLRLLFLGSLEYSANIDALTHLVGDWEPSAAELPWSVSVVGSGDAATARSIAARSERMEVVGRTENVTDAYVAFDALVVPIRLGGGSRLKIIEAMAHGLPVISTDVGVEGIDVHNGDTYLAANNGEEFTRAIQRLREPGVAATLSRRGLELSSQYSWRTIGRVAADSIDEVAAQTH